MRISSQVILELRDRTGAAIYLGASARAEYGFTPLRDGDAVEFWHVRLQALETPGHTAESISILVFDLERDATGDLAAGDRGFSSAANEQAAADRGVRRVILPRRGPKSPARRRDDDRRNEADERV